MESIKTVGIKVLKNNLSAYIRDVRHGTRVLVTDHDIVVAELREPLSVPMESQLHPLLTQWVQEGKVKLATSPKIHHYPRTGLHFPAGTAQRLLDEEREE